MRKAELNVKHYQPSGWLSIGEAAANAIAAIAARRLSMDGGVR